MSITCSSGKGIHLKFSVNRDHSNSNNPFNLRICNLRKAWTCKQHLSSWAGSSSPLTFRRARTRRSSTARRKKWSSTCSKSSCSTAKADQSTSSSHILINIIKKKKLRFNLKVFLALIWTILIYWIGLNIRLLLRCNPNLSTSVPFNPNLRHSLSHIQTSKSVPPIISHFRMSILLNVYLPQKRINSKAHRWAQASKAATTVRPMSTWSSRMKMQLDPSTTKRF